MKGITDDKRVVYFTHSRNVCKQKSGQINRLSLTNKIT